MRSVSDDGDGMKMRVQVIRTFVLASARYEVALGPEHPSITHPATGRVMYARKDNGMYVLKHATGGWPPGPAPGRGADVGEHGEVPVKPLEEARDGMGERVEARSGGGEEMRAGQRGGVASEE